MPMPPFPAEDSRHAVAQVNEASWRHLHGQRLFITGGTGFVGQWLLATLLEAQRQFGLECETVVLSRDPDAFGRRAPQLAHGKGVHLYKGDVLDGRFPDGEFSVVVHAATDVVASSTPLKTFETCTRGTRQVLDFTVRARAETFLLVSSGAVYGRQPPEMPALAEDFNGAPDVLSPSSAYGEGKRASEWLTSAYASEHGLRAVVARLFAFLGPGMPLDRHFAIGNFVRDAMAGAPIVIRGDGTPYRSYLHAADMAGWMWKILFSGRRSTAYNVGGEDAVTIAELAQRVTSLLQSTAAVEVHREPDPGVLAERYVPDVSRARRELQLDAALSLDESIRRTARWYREAVAPSDLMPSAGKAVT